MPLQDLLPGLLAEDIRILPGAVAITDERGFYKLTGLPPGT